MRKPFLESNPSQWALESLAITGGEKERWRVSDCIEAGAQRETPAAQLLDDYTLIDVEYAYFCPLRLPDSDKIVAFPELVRGGRFALDAIYLAAIYLRAIARA